MKKIVSIIVALMILVCACACAEDTQVIELGTSGLSMTIPASYAKGEITAEDTDDSQVAYYASEATAVDFDVYQWVKADGETLESIATAEAAEYESEAAAIEINGVAGMVYEATEESGGVEFATATYLFENEDVIAEVVFWLDGDNAAAEVEAMVNTIEVTDRAEISVEGTEFVLGTSSLKITTPVFFVAGELTAEDTDEGQVAYYYSDDTAVDFDVYQWAKAEGETVESVAAAEAAEYEAEAIAMDVNGIACMTYDAVEESEGTEYNTITLITEDGNDFVEIVFWADGDDAVEVVGSIIASLTK